MTSYLRFCTSGPSEKGSALKGNNLLLRGANFFLLEKISFDKDGKTILSNLPPLLAYQFRLEAVLYKALATITER